MDFLSFINSNDIKAYLHSINYECNSMEAAWLVFQSKNTSLDEKHKAWEWIIDHMPDCEIEKRSNTCYQKSLHGFLRDYMYFQKRHWKVFSKGREPRKLSDETFDLLHQSFEGWWFAFPTPFTKGDIVIDCTMKDRRGYCHGPFVLELITNTPLDIKKRQKNADNSDMNAWGLFQNENGEIYYDVIWNYMDLELYRGDLIGQERLLIAISNYLKGEIELALLLASQRTLMLRDKDENAMPDMGYDDEGLRLAGL